MSNTPHNTTEKEIKEIWERLTAGEASIKSAHKRIDELKDLSDNINNLAIATSQIAGETKALREDYSKADKRICELEDKPKKRYEQIVTLIITAVVSGVFGYLLNQLLTVIK